MVTARELGRAARAAGRSCVPALDPEMVKLLEGVEVGAGAPLLREWVAGWQSTDAAVLDEIAVLLGGYSSTGDLIEEIVRLVRTTGREVL